MRRQVVLMAKEPRAGRVKTRLGREIGMVEAAWWVRHQSVRMIRRLQDPRWELVLSVSPDRAVHGRAWPGNLPRLAQGPGDLGARVPQLKLASGRGLPVDDFVGCLHELGRESGIGKSGIRKLGSGPELHGSCTFLTPQVPNP